MARYKLLSVLLVVCLVAVNLRVSNTRTITSQIPGSADRSEILRILHDHQRFIQLNPVGTNLIEIPTAPENYQDNWLHTSGTRYPIRTYSFSNAITLIPGIGQWGEKHIQFETLLRSTESGVRTKADAPFGVSVASHWSILPGRDAGAEVSVLGVERRIECLWWMMPFVARTYDDVNASILRDLIQLGS